MRIGEDANRMRSSSSSFLLWMRWRMKDGTSEVDMNAIRWTFHTCTSPASLEGIISTMTVTSHVLVDVVVSAVDAMEDEGCRQRSGYRCYSRTFPACTPPDSLEGIISTMSATVLQMEQSKAESSLSTMLIEFFLHAYCPVLIFCSRPSRYGCIRVRGGSQQLLRATH